MTYPSHEYHEHDPEPSSGLTGFAAIKYTAIVIIVLAILAFLVILVRARLRRDAVVGAGWDRPHREEVPPGTARQTRAVVSPGQEPGIARNER